MPVGIRVDFSAVADAAFAAHEQAVQDLRSATFRAASLDEARARVAETEAALAPFREVLRAGPIAPIAYEELVRAHPPSAEQRAQGQVWDPETFTPALLAACIGQELPEGERMTEQDWADWMSTAGAGVSADLVALFRACLQVNDRRVEVFRVAV